jgi:ribonuclease BN (tRNA processing enzyme)
VTSLPFPAMLRHAMLMALMAFMLPAVAQIPITQADGPVRCGGDGVWVQVLGSGAAEFGSDRAGPGYLVWVDGHARVLVNTGPGTLVRFNAAGARFEDLDAIVYTQLQADHVSDLPPFLRAGLGSQRDRVLTVLGPEGSDRWPGLVPVVERLVGANGAFPQFQDHLATEGDASYRIRLRDVTATGSRRWAEFGTEHVRLSSMPVHHGDVPALAWRIDAGGQAITIAGSFNNQKNVVPGFAAGSDVLIVHHAIPEGARGPVRDYHVRPSQIGRIAGQVQPRVLILSYRALRTRGHQTQTLDLIAEHYRGRTVLANDEQCLGLGR